MNDDLSNIFEKLNINKDAFSPEMINNIMNIVNHTNEQSSDNSSSNSNNSDSPDIDMETILKIKSILDKMITRGNSPHSKLLQDLKPYLDVNKQSKLDQYMKIDRAMDLLPLIGGDVKAPLYNDNQVLLFSLISLLF